jgi:hypothetical protein
MRFLSQLIAAIQNSNTNSGGNYLDVGEQALGVSSPRLLALTFEWSKGGPGGDNTAPERRAALAIQRRAQLLVSSSAHAVSLLCALNGPRHGLQRLLSF